MSAAGQTICLNMIVKNEAAVIRRCLDSVRSIVDRWLIVDTGSTDGTQDIIRAHLHDVAGELHERPWQDFAHNRSEALRLARSQCDYTLIIDADDTLEVPLGFVLPPLGADSYLITILDGPLRYQRVQLVRSALPWRYEGVLHEYLTCEGAAPHAELPTICMRRNHDGARRKDPLTYRRDADILEAAIKTETNPFLVARYHFYLAQSYRDCGEHAMALLHYQQRATMGFWQEEVFISLYEAGKLMERLGHPDQAIIDAYMHAAAASPTRVEALHAAARFCRIKGRHGAGYHIAKRGLGVPIPNDALFVEPWVYETGLLDEFAVNASWCGHAREALEANLKLLAEGHLSPENSRRVAANAARLAAQQLPARPDHAQADAIMPAAPAVLPPAPNLGSAAAFGFVEQHTLTGARVLHSRRPDASMPRVLVAILAKQKAASLPLYLKCIEQLDYPKASIVLYVRTNNNTDRTAVILSEWLSRVSVQYAFVVFDPSDVDTPVERFGPHEWNPARFRVLARIRETSLRMTLEFDCAFYFVADCDNFIRPGTLRELVALNLPIVAPLLRHINSISLYSNYHAEIDTAGYWRECDQYQWILQRWVRGILEVPVVHCTYLIRRDVIGRLGYEDGSDRHEYVVFADRARREGIPQYLDNRQIYGYIHFEQDGVQPVVDGVARATKLLDQVTDILPMARSANMLRERTLLFCTAFAATRDVWERRYRRWLRAIQSSALRYDQILLVDDGSPEPPDWCDIETLSAHNDIVSDCPVVLMRYPDNLGRKAGHNYPGWYRSFAYAVAYAKRAGFGRIVHIESDSFVIGDKVANYFNGVVDDWVALWDPFFEMPESALQVAAGRGLQTCFAATQVPYDAYVGQVIERVLPFTRVERGLTGAKYPEFLDYVPRTATYVVQATEAYPDEFFWWLHNKSVPAEKSDALCATLLRSRTHVRTHHGTTVYADAVTGCLRHGPMEAVPANVWLASDGERGMFLLAKEEEGQEDEVAASYGGVFTALNGRMMTEAARIELNMPVFTFRLVRQDNGTVGLRSGKRFLCAEPDGGLSLSRRECAGWEQFSLYSA